MKQINVTKTYLPPINRYIYYLRGIWKRNWVTNSGVLVNKLERELEKYLGVKHVIFVTNGTTALQIAIKALELTDEVITTPFSNVATVSSLVWEGCRPVFADINKDFLNIDPSLIEKKVTSKTQAILATHIYGIPCDTEALNKIAKKFELKIIYDCAHGFGVNYLRKPLCSYGDISILSFHATKIFHTVEGGALVTNNSDLAKKITYMRYFGHKGQEEYWGLGINGTNSEFHAAMGLCNLGNINNYVKHLKIISMRYDTRLPLDKLSRPTLPSGTDYNYCYYSLIFPSEKILLKTQKALNNHNIFPRRYFYPSLNLLPYVTYSKNSVAEQISKQVLCLPLSVNMKVSEVDFVSRIITDIISA